jgi:transcriptional regulator with XRE-family HTH domain
VNPIDAQVGSRVRLRRMLLRMSQEKLGEVLGLTYQQVQKYERGINRIGAGRLYQVAGVLGVPVGYFYEDVPGQKREDAMPANGQSTPPIVEFFSSDDGLHLALAFMRVREPKVRKRVVDLVKSLADGVEEERGGLEHRPLRSGAPS